MFKKHKAMQSVPAHQRPLVNLLAICQSKLHIGISVLFLLWFGVYITVVIIDQHNMWFGIANMLIVLSFLPFQSSTPKRHLGAAFLKLNIRPSHCGRCEYDLRGTDGDNCPECGAQLVPKNTEETT